MERGSVGRRFLNREARASWMGRGVLPMAEKGLPG